jgi:hypothetical protein
MRVVGKRRIAITVLILFAVVLMGMGCTSKPPAHWGKVLRYKKGDSLFYTPRVTEEEARRLGNYLANTTIFNDDKPTVVQLTKEGQVYQVRVVTAKEVLERERDPQEIGPVEAAGLLAEDISKEVFNGAKVEWHICDDKLKTMRVGSY